jgi:hypothetical protein
LWPKLGRLEEKANCQNKPGQESREAWLASELRQGLESICGHTFQPK